MSYWDSPVMKGLLENFGAELKQVEINFRKNFRQEDPLLLYHYTRKDNLENILRGKSLWVTNIQYLNDKSEFTYGIEIINRVLDQKSYENKFKQIVRALTRKFAEKIGDFYVLSLTKNPDNLLLWSNYAGLDGYHIGFNYSRLQFLLEGMSFDDSSEYVKSNFDVIDGNVIYSTKEQETIISESFDRLHYSYKKYEDVSETDQFKILNASIFYEIVHFITLFKDTVFSQEEEYRFVFEKGENIDVKLRQGEGIKIPYISLEFAGGKAFINGLPIRIIGLGPKNESTSDKLTNISNLCVYKDIDFYSSKIPLR